MAANFSLNGACIASCRCILAAPERRPRTLPLAGFPDGEKIVLIASNFGQSRHPAWYHNLKANPECVLMKKGQAGTYSARETEGEEREHYYAMAISYYIGYAAYRQRAANRKNPVMVLEPKR